jgi:hypothetical protein
MTILMHLFSDLRLPSGCQAAYERQPGSPGPDCARAATAQRMPRRKRC